MPVTLILLLVVLIILLGGGGATYGSWGRGAPAWGGNVLYLLALVVVVILVLNLIGAARF